MVKWRKFFFLVNDDERCSLRSAAKLPAGAVRKLGS